MTSDGTNSKAWDAESRLIKINYPGMNNFSQFTFDSLGRNTKILEVSRGSTTSTKQFVWCGSERYEERDSGRATTKAFYTRGEIKSGTSHFYTKDHIGTIHEMSDSSGNLQAQYSFDLYGRGFRILGNDAPTFQYAGYYFHANSGLYLTRTRTYSSSQGRFFNRDPIEEAGGINLYCYVKSNPVSFADPTGLIDDYTNPHNCAGYGCSDSRRPDHPLGPYSAPDPEESFGDYFSSRKWRCTPMKSGKPCKCACDEKKIYVFLIGGDMSSTGSSSVYWHMMGYDVPVIPTEAQSPIPGWSEAFPGTSPRPVPFDPDSAAAAVPGNVNRYCCCKRKEVGLYGLDWI
ncbi:MAG: RHS repeat domain-containing protein [Candidatus Obscuribacterales bacterium]